MDDGTRRNRAERVGDLVEQLLKRADARGALRAARACAAWEEVAGPLAARHSKAIRVTDGELLVAVDTPAWATEMSLMKDRYLEEIQARVGKDAVRSIRFTVSKRASASAQRATAPHEPRKRHVPARLDESEAEAIRAEVASRVADEGLRDAIAKARIAFRRADRQGSDKYGG